MSRAKANARDERMMRFVCLWFFMFYCFLFVFIRRQRDGKRFIGACWLMFFHQFHGALRAIAGGVLHNFGVHRAGVLMGVSAVLGRLGLFATRHAKIGEAECHRHQ